MQVVIIEDEPFAQNEITRLLQQVKPEIEILTYLESLEDAVEWFATNEHPPLVFLDIQLSDGISFDIFTELTINSSIIFTTAYDEYAIRAFKLNSIDYLLKPIDKNALAAALQKFDQLQHKYQNSQQSLTAEQLSGLLQLASQNSEYKSRIMTKIGDQLRFTKTDEIAYLFAEDNEVLLMNVNGKKSIVDISLDNIGKLLDPKEFHRINRKYMVHKNAIIKVHKYFNSRLKLELQPNRDEEILISRVKVQEFLDWMER